jgi:hypothetical protein
LLSRSRRKSVLRGTIDWIRGWWTTWQVWSHADAEQREILLGKHDPDDFVEAERPE